MRALVALDLCDAAELRRDRAELHAYLADGAIRRGLLDRRARQAGRNVLDPAKKSQTWRSG
jgi:hypothetical protein